MLEVLFADHHALEERHWWFRGRRAAIRRLSQELVRPGGCIVDVGCGTGADIAALPSDRRRYGIDRSESAIEFARSRHAGVGFSVADLPDTGAAALIAEADLVLLCDVLEHVEDHHRFLAWLIDSMRPGSHLLMTVPAGPQLWSPHDESYGHYRRYTRDTLSDTWCELPVRQRLLANFNYRLYPLARVSRAASRLRGRAWSDHSTDLVLPPAPLNAVLGRIFEGEANRLADALLGRRRANRLPGVSLLAVLERTATSEQPPTSGRQEAGRA